MPTRKQLEPKPEPPTEPEPEVKPNESKEKTTNESEESGDTVYAPSLPSTVAIGTTANGNGSGLLTEVGNRTPGETKRLTVSEPIDLPERLLKAKLHQKKIRVAAQIGSIEKTGIVDFVSKRTGERTFYSYATEADVLEPITKFCNRESLSPTFHTVKCDVTPSSKGVDQAFVIVSLTITDCETGYEIKVIGPEIVARKEEASSKVAVSHAKRVTALMAFGLSCTGTAPDADDEPLILPKNPDELKKPVPIPIPLVTEQQAKEIVQIVRESEIPIDVVTQWIGYDKPGLIPASEFQAVKSNLVSQIANWKKNIPY